MHPQVESHRSEILALAERHGIRNVLVHDYLEDDAHLLTLRQSDRPILH